MLIRTNTSQEWGVNAGVNAVRTLTPHRNGVLTQVLTLLERVVKTLRCEHRATGGVKRACEDSLSSHLLPRPPPYGIWGVERRGNRRQTARARRLMMERGAERTQLAENVC